MARGRHQDEGFANVVVSTMRPQSNGRSAEDGRVDKQTFVHLHDSVGKLGWVLQPLGARTPKSTRLIRTIVYLSSPPYYPL